MARYLPPPGRGSGASALGTANGRARNEVWLERWLQAVSALARLKANHPMHGAAVRRFEHGSAERREGLLKQGHRAPRVVCMDGVNSMTGNAPDLAAFARVTREHDALLYVDDAHGFGVIGEKPSFVSPYGHKGNGIVRYFGEDYENVVLIAGLSKAYSSLLAFVACPSSMKDFLKVAAPPYLYSGPSPIA